LQLDGPVLAVVRLEAFGEVGHDRLVVRVPLRLRVDLEQPAVDEGREALRREAALVVRVEGGWIARDARAPRAAGLRATARGRFSGRARRRRPFGIDATARGRRGIVAIVIAAAADDECRARETRGA